MESTKANIISQLQKDILLLQGFKPSNAAENDAGLGIIKQAFPSSTFPIGAIHEFFSTRNEDSAAACGFIAGIVSSLMESGSPSVWISSSGLVFPPALKLFGIDPHKVLFIQSTKRKEILWTIEEALKTDSISTVIGEISDISFIESRRLQLAVEESKVTGFLLRQNPRNLSTACVTRWRVKPLPSAKELLIPGMGFPKWNVELLKVRNGKPGQWQMQWRKGKFELIHQEVFIEEKQERKIV